MATEQRSGNRPPRRGSGSSSSEDSSKRAAVELAKVALGGAAGVAIAVLLLWYGFSRDPLGLFTSGDDAAPGSNVALNQSKPQEPSAPRKTPKADTTSTGQGSAGAKQTAAAPQRNSPPGDTATTSQPVVVAQAAPAEPQQRPADASAPQSPAPTSSNNPATPPVENNAAIPPAEKPAESEPSVATASAAASISAASSANESDSRRESPGPQVQEQNRKRIREIFADEFRAPTADAKVNLALLLEREANKLQKDDDARFTLLREAYLLGLDAGRLDLAADMVRMMDADYRIDLDRVRLHMVGKLAETSRNPEERRRVADAALDYARQAIDRERHDVAVALAEVGEALALKSRDAALRKTARDLAESARRMERAKKAVEPLLARLEKNPDDAEANSLYGTYVCTAEGDWAKGLPMLAKGNDEQLRRAATRDQESPAEPEAQIELADLWASIADSDPELVNFNARAAIWYKEAQPRATGLKRIKVERRLGEIAKLEIPSRFFGRSGISGSPAEPPSYSSANPAKAPEAAPVAAAPTAPVARDAPSPASPTIVAKAAPVDPPVVVKTVNSDPAPVSVARAAIDKPKSPRPARNDDVPILAGGEGRLPPAKGRPVAIAVRPKTGIASSANQIHSLAFLEDGTLAAAGTDNRVHFWNLATGMRQEVVHDPAGVEIAAFAPDASLVATGVRDGGVKLWSVPERSLTATLFENSTQLECLAFTPDSRRLVTGGYDPLRLWDAQAKKLERILSGPEGTYKGAAFTADGSRMAAFGANRRGQGLVALWDLTTGKCIGKLPDPKWEVRRAAFSPDGALLITGNDGHLFDPSELIVYDARTGAVIKSLPGHAGQVNAIVFSLDGRVLATAAVKGMHLWDAARLELRHTITPDHAPSSVAFSPDGTTLATATGTPFIDLREIEVEERDSVPAAPGPNVAPAQPQPAAAPPPNDAPPRPIEIGLLEDDSAVRLPGDACLALDHSDNRFALGQEFTVELWCRVNAIVSGRCLVGTLKPFDNRKGTWGVMVHGRGRPQVIFLYEDANGQRKNTTTTPIPSNKEWHHVAVVGTATHGKVYVDGMLLVEHELFDPPAVPDPLEQFYIAAPMAPSQNAEDRVDVRSLRISEGVLYSEAQFTPPESFEKTERTLALFDFSRFEGGKFADLSGHGRDARPIAAPKH
jgi:WD40 repeat protein